MDKNKITKLTIGGICAAVGVIMCWGTLTEMARAVTYYPPGALLQPNDVTSSHIRDNTITGADIARDASTTLNDLHVTNLVATGTAALPAASISSSTIAGDSIMNNHIASTSAIADTKLDTIVSSSKVSGAALFNLDFIPAGAGVIPTANISGVSKISIDMTAGADIAAGAPVFIATTTVSTSTIIALGGGDGDFPVGSGVGGSQKVGQSFTESLYIESFMLTLKKQGAPVNNLICGIQADSGGLPSGTWLASASINGAELTTLYADYKFQLNHAVQTSSSTTYWLFCDVDTGYSNIDRYLWNQLLVGTYAGGAPKYWDGTTWLSATSDLTAGLHMSLSSGKVYEARADNIHYYDTYIGINETAVASSTTATIDILGLSTANIGMTAGLNMYLANGWGATSTTPGLYPLVLGRAASSTGLILK